MDNATPQGRAEADAGNNGQAQEVRDLQVILGVTRAMAAAIELNELLELILNSVRQILNAERASLFLYDPGTDELHSTIAHGTGEIRFPAGAGIAGAAAQGRKLINIPDAYEDPRLPATSTARRATLPVASWPSRWSAPPASSSACCRCSTRSTASSPGTTSAWLRHSRPRSASRYSGPG